MWNKEVKTKLYVSLDSLMDTELAIVLMQCNSKKKIRRYLDKFKKTETRHPAVALEILSAEVFNEAWTKRGKDVLLSSGMTLMVDKVRELIDEHADVINRDPYMGTLTLVIDTHPYQLNKDERNILASGLTTHIGFDTKIEYIYQGELSLTPDLLQEYAWAIIKDSDNWIARYVKAAKNHPRLLETRVMFPATNSGVSIKELIDDPNIDMKVLSNEDPHKLVTRILSQYIDVTMISPLFFKAT